MVTFLEVAVASASTIARLSAYAFLRWIPGHHFPPVIVSATAIYLTLVAVYSRSFGASRPSLREAFPKLFRKLRNDSTETVHRYAPAQTDHDEPALYHEEKTILRTLILGIPHWQEWEYSYLTIALNVLVTILSLDLVFRAPLLYDGKDLKFSRLGHIDHASAKILVRDPNPADLPIYAYVKRTNHPDWTTVDRIFRLTDETDYTYPMELSGLTPDTTYVYALSNELNGTFRTAPAPSTDKAKTLTFLTSSCIKANFPYSPFAHSLSIPGLKQLSKTLRMLQSVPSFMLFLGDFIYVDVPLRLSTTQAHYRAEYRRVYASPSWKLPGLQLPWIHTLDDHEIANDWAGGNETEPFPAASDPFMHYHVSVNPPLPSGVPIDFATNATYFQFIQGPASFFMMDTRRYRTQPRTSEAALLNTGKPLYGSFSSGRGNLADAPSMLGSAQLQSLLAYLTKPEPVNVHWKIVASSVPFTKNWRFGTSDTWGGFPSERKRVLEAMHFAEANLGVRVVLLSGDRHEFAAIRFPPSASRVHSRDNEEGQNDGPHEFSVGPLSMFYLPIRTFKQVDDEDIALAYFPDGNSKLGVIDIFPADKSSISSGGSLLRYSLWIDGHNKWQYTLHSPGLHRSKRSNLDSWRYN